MEMKTLATNRKAEHLEEVSLLIFEAEDWDKVFFCVNYGTKEEWGDGFNVVMSNLKFKHNKSGFLKILRFRIKKEGKTFPY